MAVGYSAWFVVAVALVVPACSKKPDSATMERELVGAWSFNPRKQLPQEKIQNNAGAGTTPDETIFQFGPGEGGLRTYVEYVHIPRHTLDIPSQKVVPPQWRIKPKDTWYVAHGKVYLSSEAFEFKSTVVRLDSGVLRLSGGLFECKSGSCTLHRLKALPDAARAGYAF